jgi:hypothetical protein
MGWSGCAELPVFPPSPASHILPMRGDSQAGRRAHSANEALVPPRNGHEMTWGPVWAANSHIISVGPWWVDVLLSAWARLSRAQGT